jgi:hypothetical protein
LVIHSIPESIASCRTVHTGDHAICLWWRSIIVVITIKVAILRFNVCLASKLLIDLLTCIHNLTYRNEAIPPLFRYRCRKLASPEVAPVVEIAIFPALVKDADKTHAAGATLSQLVALRCTFLFRAPEVPKTVSSIASDAPAVVILILDETVQTS